MKYCALGTNRVVYKAESFGTGKTVTAYIWNPSRVKSSQQTLTEIESGLYYLDYSFTPLGNHIGLFYEDDVVKAYETFRVVSTTESYTTGVNMIPYKAESFGTGKTVTAYIWDSSLTKSDEQTLTEIESGLYYLDYNFGSLGTHIGLFYEDGVAKAPGTFRVGTTAKTYTLTDGVDPIEGAWVWVTSDLAGDSVIDSGKTDENGQATFYLNAGTVYIWRQHDNYTFSNPDTETVE